MGLEGMRMRVYRKTVAEEAWQFRPSNGQPNPPGQELPYWVVMCTIWDPNTKEMYLQRRSGKQRIEAGEWLLRDLDGEPIWFTDDEFRRHYEVMK
jgi:hypothetical protein